jgi:hypothetical protein
MEQAGSPAFHEIDAATDTDALHQARSIGSGIRSELWQRDRLIGKLDGRQIRTDDPRAFGRFERRLQ